MPAKVGEWDCQCGARNPVHAALCRACGGPRWQSVTMMDPAPGRLRSPAAFLWVTVALVAAGLAWWSCFGFPRAAPHPVPTAPGLAPSQPREPPLLYPIAPGGPEMKELDGPLTGPGTTPPVYYTPRGTAPTPLRPPPP